MPPDELLAVVKAYLRQLGREFQAANSRLTTAYMQTIGRMNGAVRNFEQAVTRIWDDENPPTVSEIERLPEFRQLEQTTETEMNRFTAILENEVVLLAGAAILLGQRAARQKTLASAGGAGAETLNKLLRTPEQRALDILINYATGPAMQAKYAAFGPDAAKLITGGVIDGFRTGKNPRQVAREIARSALVPYAWAENMARTVHLYSYRRSSSAFYRANSAFITGVMWWSAQDTRTCLSCWAMHGTIMSLDEEVNDHHRGRCDGLPVVRGTTWAQDVVSGPDVFKGLPEMDQRQIMRTPAMYNAWQAGAVQFDQMTRTYQNEVYGEMRRAASLVEILGTDAQQYYVRST